MTNFLTGEWLQAVYEHYLGAAPEAIDVELPLAVAAELQLSGNTDRADVAAAIRRRAGRVGNTGLLATQPNHVDLALGSLMDAGFLVEVFRAACPQDHDHNAETCEERVLEFRLPEESRA
ncbi:hypothetical protein ABQF34_07205 [Mycolicibacterium boenickei]